MASSVFPQSWFDQSFIEPLLFSTSRARSPWDPRGLQSIPLPATCTYDTWRAGQGCKVAYPETVTGATFQLAMDRCPGSPLPYVSLSCSGAACARFARPCASVGSAAECGAAGLTCVNPAAAFGDYAGSSQTLVVDVLTAMGAIDSAADIAGCGDAASGTGSGAAEVTRRIRDKLFSMWGLPAPPKPSPDAEVQLGLCMPSKDAVKRAGDRISDPVSAGVTTSVAPFPNTPAMGACLAKGCNVSWVGNGRCNLPCYNAECKWDGSDCGAGGLTQVDVSKRAPKSDSDAWCTLPASSAAPGINVMEPCNGLTDGSRYGEGAQFEYVYPGSMSGYTTSWGAYCRYGAWDSSDSQRCSCNCPLKPGFTAPGSYCENCKPLPPCPGYYSANGTLRADISQPPCTLQKATVGNLNAYITTWDGVLASGGSVLAMDRKSGQVYSTPADRYEPAVAPSPAAGNAMVPLLQTTCSGEFALSFLHPRLGLSLSLPRLQELASFLHETGHFVQSCRIKAADGSLLSQAQYLTRWGLHQLAGWFYQLSWSGKTAAASGIDALRSGLGSMVSDWLFVAREPAGAASLSDPSFFASSWATSWRMNPPNAAECSLASLLSPGNRRCRFSYTALGQLLSSATSQTTATLHVDLRNDVCAGTPIAGGASLTATSAAYGVPILSAWLESSLARAFVTPRTCVSDADCAVLPGTMCYNLNDAVDVATLLPARIQNPLAALVYGSFNPGDRPCSAAVDFKRSLRNMLLLGLSGRAPDGGSDLKVCGPRVQTAMDNAADWARGLYSSGPTCTHGYACMPGQSTPLGNSAPATVAWFAPPVFDGLYTPRTAASDAAVVPAPPPRLAVSFKLLLPTLTPATFTNALRTKIVAAIADALAARGIIVPPTAITVTAVQDSSAQVAGSARVLALDTDHAEAAVRALQAAATTTSAVAVTFSVDTTQTSLTPAAAAAGTTVDAALTAQLTTAPAAGTSTVAAVIGSTLVASGVIPVAASSATTAQASTWIPPAPVNSGSSGSGSDGGSALGPAVGGAVGGLLVLAAVGAAVFIFVVRPRRAAGRTLTTAPSPATSNAFMTNPLESARKPGNSHAPNSFAPHGTAV
jgi:hypothetical protein